MALLPLLLGGCEAASSMRGAGLSDPKLMKSINDAYEARDNCLVANIHLADAFASAQSLAAQATASCQTQTDVLNALSIPMAIRGSPPRSRRIRASGRWATC